MYFVILDSISSYSFILCNSFKLLDHVIIVAELYSLYKSLSYVVLNLTKIVQFRGQHFETYKKQ